MGGAWIFGQGPDGEPIPVAVDEDGELIISNPGGGGGGGGEGTAEEDDANFTAGSTLGTPSMGVYESSPSSVTDGDLGIVGITQTRALKVSDATAQGILTTMDADTGAIATAVQIMDDWDESDRAKVNLIVGQAGVAAGAGAVGATVQRVTQASDSPAVVALQIMDDWDESDRAKVNIIAGQAGITAGAGTVGASTPRVTLASNDPAVTALSAIQTAVQLIDNMISGNEAQVDVVAALPAGANLVGDVGLSGARTSGGTTPYKNLDVDQADAQVKGTAGQVYWIHAINLGTAPRYLKFYNATAANVTVGTTTPVLTFPIPTQGDSNGAGFTFSIPNGIAFSTAITIAATTGFADNDTGAPGANEVIVNLGYA